MKNQKIMFTSVLLALACFTASPDGTGKARADAHPRHRLPPRHSVKTVAMVTARQRTLTRLV